MSTRFITKQVTIGRKLRCHGKKVSFCWMRANTSWRVLAENFLKWSFCSFFYNLDEGYQAQNKARDDQDKIEVSRDRGIVLLNESKCTLISICRKLFEVMFLWFFNNLVEEYQGENKARDDQDETEVSRVKGMVLLNNEYILMGICWSFFEEIFFWIVVEFRQGVSGSKQSNWWSGESSGVKGQRYCFFLMRVNASWWVSAEHSLKWCFCGFCFNLDDEYQAQNEARDDQEEFEVSREKGIFCWMRVNASWWVSAKHSLKRFFCGFLLNLDKEYQAQNKAIDDREEVQVSRDKGIVFFLMRVNASWLVSAEHSLKWCFCGFWFNLDEEYQAPNEANDDHEESVSRDKGIFCWMRVNASLWVSAKHSLKWCFCGFLFNLEEEYQAQNKERDKGKVLLSESKWIFISIYCKVFKRMFLCCKFFRRMFLCSFM